AVLRKSPGFTPTPITFDAPLTRTALPIELPFDPSVFASRGSNQSTAKPTPARSVLQSEPCVYHTQPPATVTFTALPFVAVQMDAGIDVFVVVHVSVLTPCATSIAGLTGPPFR